MRGLRSLHFIVFFALAATQAVLASASLVAGIEQEDPHSLSAPRTYEGAPLTLAGAIEEALNKNPDLISLRQLVNVARLRPSQERFLDAPMVEATVWQWPIDTLNPTNTNMYMFMIGQDFPGRGKRALRAAAAEKDLALADSDVMIRARQIVNEIKQAYTSLYIARKAIELHIASVLLLQQIADVSQARYATGRISQQDVLKPVLELSKLHGDIIMFDEQASLATARLNVLLDRSPDAPIGPLVEPHEQMLVPSSADLQRMAVEHQPELQRAHLETDRAQTELASAKQEYKPDFTVQGGYLVMPNQRDALLGRVGITWPKAPWSRGKVDARVAEQSAAVAAATARERAMENSLRLTVQEAYVRAKSAQGRAALLRTTILPQSQQTLDVSQVGYETDRVDFQAVIDNERTLLDSRLDYYRAVNDFEQAIADLERAIGTDLPEGTVTPVAEHEGH